jgi:cell division protein FtsX
MKFVELFWSEVHEWWMVFLEHKIRYVISFFVFVFLLVLFQVSLRGYQFLGATLEFVTSEVDIVMDLKEGITLEDTMGVQEYLNDEEGVLSVEYFSPTAVLDFIDREVVPGYGSFLKESKVSVSFSPLLSISVDDVELLKNLKSRLFIEFPAVFLGTSNREVNQEVISLADNLLALSLRFSGLMYALCVLVGMASLFMLVYLIYSFLVARKKEFHLVNLLGLKHHFHCESFIGIALFLGLLGYGVMLMVVSVLGFASGLLWVQLFMVLLLSFGMGWLMYRF